MQLVPSPSPWLPASPEQILATGSSGIDLWLMWLDDPALKAAEQADILSVDERERAARFHFDVDRRRFEVVHGLLRRVIGAYVGIEPSLLAFRIAERGKPFLAIEPACGLQFNLSHSQGWALLGLSRSAEIGVDVEVVRPVPEMVDIARRNFAPAEFESWTRLPVAEHQAAFFACWTRKEAVIKAVGDGLSMPLDSFEVSVDPAHPARLLSIDGNRALARQWTLRSFRPAAEVWVSVAGRADGGKVGISTHSLLRNSGG